MNQIGRAFLQYRLFALAVHLFDPDQRHHRAVHQNHQIVQRCSLSVTVHCAVLVVCLHMDDKGTGGRSILRRGRLDHHVSAIGQAGRCHDSSVVALNLRCKIRIFIICIIRYPISRTVTVSNGLYQLPAFHIRTVCLLIDDCRTDLPERRIVQGSRIAEIINHGLRQILIRHICVFSASQLRYQINRELRSFHRIKTVRIVCSCHLIEGQRLLLHLLIDLIIRNLNNRCLLILINNLEFILFRICQIALAGFLFLQIIAAQLQIFDDDSISGSDCHSRRSVLIIPVSAHTILCTHVADLDFLASLIQHCAALVLMHNIFCRIEPVLCPCKRSIALGYGILRFQVILGKSDFPKDSLIVKSSILIIGYGNRGLILCSIRGNRKVIHVLVRISGILRHPGIILPVSIVSFRSSSLDNPVFSLIVRRIIEPGRCQIGPFFCLHQSHTF